MRHALGCRIRHHVRTARRLIAAGCIGKASLELTRAEVLRDMRASLKTSRPATFLLAPRTCRRPGLPVRKTRASRRS